MQSPTRYTVGQSQAVCQDEEEKWNKRLGKEGVYSYVTKTSMNLVT